MPLYEALEKIMLSNKFMDHVFLERESNLSIIKEIDGETLKTEYKTFDFSIITIKRCKRLNYNKGSSIEL